MSKRFNRRVYTKLLNMSKQLDHKAFWIHEGQDKTDYSNVYMLQGQVISALDSWIITKFF